MPLSLQDVSLEGIWRDVWRNGTMTRQIVIGLVTALAAAWALKEMV